jgi:hypothetical protein
MMTPVDPDEYMGCDVIVALQKIKPFVDLIEYHKIEDDEFLKLPELGISFHAGGNSELSDFRVYLIGRDEFYAAKDSVVNKYLISRKIDDAVVELGEVFRDIPSIKIPGARPTLPGKAFVKNGCALSLYYDEHGGIVSVVVRPNVSS